MASGRELNADLHAHSTASDGALAPQQLVERAAARGVELLALTDHDTMAGIADARAAAQAHGLRFVAGVEVSASYAGRTIHVVGLGVDPGAATLQAGLASVRAEREARAVAIAAGLADAGIVDALAGARRQARNPELVTRTHFARFLVEAGAAPSLHDVFRRFLVEGRPGYVAPRWATLAQAVGWIRGGGGVAVLAHPGRYHGDDAFHWALAGAFRDAGGVAIEVASGSHGTAAEPRFAALARALDLEASRGSDFHAADESRVDLGRVRALPTDLVPVWRRFS